MSKHAEGSQPSTPSELVVQEHELWGSIDERSVWGKNRSLAFTGQRHGFTLVASTGRGPVSVGDHLRVLPLAGQKQVDYVYVVTGDLNYPNGPMGNWKATLELVRIRIHASTDESTMSFSDLHRYITGWTA